MSEVAVEVVKWNLLAFNVLGSFGILLGFLAFCDIICLWFELQSFVRLSFGIFGTSLRSCFYWNCGYIFTECLEVYVILALSIDRHLAIIIPIRYRTIKLKKYLLWLIAPGVLIGVLFVAISYARLSNVTRDICVLPYAMPDEVSRIWNLYNTVGAILIMIIYGMTYLKLYYFDSFKNDPNQKNKQKAILSTVIFQALIFFVSSVLSAMMIMGVRAMGWESLAVDADTLAVIPGKTQKGIHLGSPAWIYMQLLRLLLTKC